MALRDEIVSTLSRPDSRLTEPQFDLEETAGGKVGGFVISPAFEGMAQIDRQNMVWDYLESHLTKEQLLGIVSLVTLTPDEVKTEA